MLGKLLCFLGFHDWRFFVLIGLTLEGCCVEGRACKRCDKAVLPIEELLTGYACIENQNWETFH